MCDVARSVSTFPFEPMPFDATRYFYILLGMREQFDTSVKGLEGACAEGLVYSLTNADARYIICKTHVVIFSAA